MSSIRKNIIDAILTDDSHSSKDCARIVQIYKSSTESEKSVVDNIFISLCGYSLNTIISSETNAFKSEIKLNNLDI